ncbi:MAG: LysR family transcriptional regulator [Xanthobacteraceae bacterium]
MTDWEDLKHFAVFAREGTLSAAAGVLGVDHATVARRIAALEASVEVKLVDRRSRSYSLTAEGKRVAEIAAGMEAAAFDVGRVAQAAKPGLHREVAISAPPSLSISVIAPQLSKLRARHPGITIKLTGEKRTASLNRREADVALRLSRPTEPGLISRRIGSFAFGLYGAPAYIKATSGHSLVFIAYDRSMDDSPQQQWLYAVAAGRQIVLRTNDLENQAAAARAGVGLATLPRFLGDGDPTLQAYEVRGKPVSRDVWLVVHRDLRQVPAIRAVMEFLTDCVKVRRDKLRAVP